MGEAHGVVLPAVGVRVGVPAVRGVLAAVEDEARDDIAVAVSSAVRLFSRRRAGGYRRVG